VDQALFAVVMEAYLHSVSTRKIDDLVKAMGGSTANATVPLGQLSQRGAGSQQPHANVLLKPIPL
jgi:hypothetical protein